MATIKRLNPDNVAGNAAIKAPVAKKPKVEVVKRPASSAETARAAGIKAGKIGAANPVSMLASEVTRSRENAVEFLTGVQTRGNKVKVDPLGLAMALPVGKVAKAAGVLMKAGKMAEAIPLVDRLVAKGIGNPGSKRISKALRGIDVSIVPGSKAGRINSRDIQAGRLTRGEGSRAYPRLPSGGGIPGAKRSFNVLEDPLLEGAYRFNGKRKAR